MKTILFGIVLAMLSGACGNHGGNASDKPGKGIEATKPDTITTNNTANQPASSGAVVSAYLQLKNALAADDSKEAATAANELTAAIRNLGGSALGSEQKIIYNEVNAEITEHAEHIAANAGNIKHQREHFDPLSQDIFDLVKSVKPSQVLYKDFCPMYNDKKGAIWLSETKGIKNPYYGKEMLTCGTVEEEIK